MMRFSQDEKKYFNRDFSIVKREITIFPENFRSLNILSKMFAPEINIKCHDRLSWDQNILIKPTILPEFKAYEHALSPEPMQNPYSKLFLTWKFNLLSDFQFFFCTFYDFHNLLPNIG